MRAKPSAFVTWHSPQSQIFKNSVPVSQLRLRTHKLARPSAVFCTYYLLLGQNLFKSACNSMKPQQLHLQTIWPTIFSSLVVLMQREKLPLSEWLLYPCYSHVLMSIALSSRIPRRKQKGVLFYSSQKGISTKKQSILTPKYSYSIAKQQNNSLGNETSPKAAPQLPLMQMVFICKGGCSWRKDSTLEWKGDSEL